MLHVLSSGSLAREASIFKRCNFLLPLPLHLRMDGHIWIPSNQPKFPRSTASIQKSFTILKNAMKGIPYLARIWPLIFGKALCTNCIATNLQLFIHCCNSCSVGNSLYFQPLENHCRHRWISRKIWQTLFDSSPAVATTTTIAEHKVYFSAAGGAIVELAK